MKRTRRADHEAPAGPTMEGSRSPAESTETTDRLELAQVLAEAIHGLRKPYRGALHEHYYEGKSTSPIADRGRVAPATVGALSTLAGTALCARSNGPDEGHR